MIDAIKICDLTQADIISADRVFEEAIPDALDKEGLGSLVEEIKREVEYKKHLLDLSLSQDGSDMLFKIAKLGETVVGTIAFGPCGEDIKKCTGNQLDGVGELGSLYILPDFQGQGIGSALIKAMAGYLYKQGIAEFCLDSGYKRAQKKWLRKFGEPYKVAKDYWGKGNDHMIWLCKVVDFK